MSAPRPVSCWTSLSPCGKILSKQSADRTRIKAKQHPERSLQRLRVLFLQRNYGLLALDVLVDGLGGGLAGTHGLDDGSSAGHGVTASVHALAAGLALVALGDDAAVPVGLEARRCLLYTSPSPRDLSTSRMPSSA